MNKKETKKKKNQKAPKTNSKKSTSRKGPKWVDGSFKRFYSLPTMVRDLIDCFVDDNLIDKYDPNRMERVPDTHINSALSEKRNDRIWRLHTENGEVLLHLILEFQSSNDPSMPVRILEYSVLTILDLYRDQIKKSEKIPPILPIVIYCGKSAWTAPQFLSEIFMETSPALKRYLTEQGYYLLDILRISDESLKNENSLNTMFFRMERCRLIDNFIIECKKTINRLQDREEDEVIDIFIDWIKNVFTKRFKKVLPRNIKFNNRRDIAMFSVALDEIYDNLCQEREEAANVKKELQRVKKEKDLELLKMRREKDEELLRVKKEKDEELREMMREKDEELLKMRREKDEELLRVKKKNEELEKKLISLLDDVKKRTVK